MANKTVIITTLNEAWAAKDTMIDLFLQSFKRGHSIEHLLQHLVVVTLDGRAHERCLQLHRFCFRLQTEGVDFAGEKKFMSDDYLRMMWRRIKFLGDVLDLGYSFVFSVCCALYLSPFPQFPSPRHRQCNVAFNRRSESFIHNMFFLSSITNVALCDECQEPIHTL